MSKITILDKFVTRQIMLYVLFTLLVFTVVWVAPEILREALELITKKTLTPVEAGLFIVYQLPEVFLYAIPIASLIGTVFFFRRISLSSELIAILASGISLKRILMPVAFVGLLMSTLFFLNQEWVTPWATAHHQAMKLEKGIVKPDQLNQYVTLSEPDKTGALKGFLLYAKHPKANEKAFVYMAINGSNSEDRWLSSITSAQDANWDTQIQKWSLSDVDNYNLNAEGVYTDTQHLPTMSMGGQTNLEEILNYTYTLPIQMSVSNLMRHIATLEDFNQHDQARYFSVRLLQRFIQPFAPLVFALIALGVGVERSRSKRNLGLVFASLLLIAYNIMLSSFTSLGSLGILPAFVAAILPLSLTLLLGIGVMRYRKVIG